MVLQSLTNFELEHEVLARGRGSVTVQVLEQPERTLKQIWPLPIPLLGLCGVIGVTAGIVFSSFVQSLRLYRRRLSG